MKLILLGPPGSGKGTQADKLAARFDIDHISTGDLFREAKQRDTEFGRMVRDLMGQGDLIPDDVTNRIVNEKVHGLDGFILDGYPRNLDQARNLDGIGLDHAIHLDVSDDEVIRRITNRRTCTECGTGYNLIYVQPDEEGVCDRCGGDLVQREDSKPDVVKKRLRIYHDTTKPLIDYYSDRDLLVHINGEQPIQKVYDDITDRITA